MPAWEVTQRTTWQACWTCGGCVTRHDSGICMYDPASPIARLVRRDLPPALLVGNPHEPASLFDLPNLPHPGGGTAGDGA